MTTVIDDALSPPPSGTKPNLLDLVGPFTPSTWLNETCTHTQVRLQPQKMSHEKQVRKEL